MYNFISVPFASQQPYKTLENIVYDYLFFKSCELFNEDEAGSVVMMMLYQLTILPFDRAGMYYNTVMTWWDVSMLPPPHLLHPHPLLLIPPLLPQDLHHHLPPPRQYLLHLHHP